MKEKCLQQLQSPDYFAPGAELAVLQEIVPWLFVVAGVMRRTLALLCLRIRRWRNRLSCPLAQTVANILNPPHYSPYTETSASITIAQVSITILSM